MRLNRLRRAESKSESVLDLGTRGGDRRRWDLRHWFNVAVDRVRQWLYAQVINADDELSAAYAPSVVMTSQKGARGYVLATALCVCSAFVPIRTRAARRRSQHNRARLCEAARHTSHDARGARARKRVPIARLAA